MKWSGGPVRPASTARGTSSIISLQTIRYLFLVGLLAVTARADAVQDVPAPIDGEVESSMLATADLDMEAMAASRAQMSRQLADNLALLFDKFERSEFILCLEGEVSAHGQLSLSDFRMPHIVRSHATSAALSPAGTCAQYERVIATLHTHPPTYPEDRGRESSNCYLSRTDIVTWLEGTDYPYTAVLCGPRTWAVWHRSQVKPKQVIAFPPEDQLHEPEAEEISAAEASSARGR